jgi:hypothetical protein
MRVATFTCVFTVVSSRQHHLKLLQQNSVSGELMPDEKHLLTV